MKRTARAKVPSSREVELSPRGAGATPRRPVPANTVFFPAATLYAIFALPASVLAATGVTGAFPALASGTAHAHEMLFGFALAVVAGNQLGALPISRLAPLFGLWALGRVAVLAAPHSIAAAALNVAFDVAVAAHVAPRLFGAAKKLRHGALPFVLTAICAAGIASEVAPVAGLASVARAIPIVGVLRLAPLMLFMGGGSSRQRSPARSSGKAAISMPGCSRASKAPSSSR